MRCGVCAVWNRILWLLLKDLAPLILSLYFIRYTALCCAGYAYTLLCCDALNCDALYHTVVYQTVIVYGVAALCGNDHDRSWSLGPNPKT
jgi:hypothetical protein